jgi:hypothetical protein
MRRLKSLFAFVSGCVTTGAAGWLAVGLDAQGWSPNAAVHVCVAADGLFRYVELTAACPSGERSLFLKRAEADVELPKPDEKPKTPECNIDPARLAELERRLRELENRAGRGALASRVVAPFEVVDRRGRPIFSVEAGFVRLHNSAGGEVVRPRATDTGGYLETRSGDGGVRAAIGAGGRNEAPDGGLKILEGNVERVTIGRRGGGDGSYVALFHAQSGTRVAGIGQSTHGRGAAYVADVDGNVRARMTVEADGRGLIAVTNAANFNVLTLTEGHSAGGLLKIANANGDDRMVQAGVTADGVGVVRAGPEGFQSGVGLLGLPGSYIIGKP